MNSTCPFDLASYLIDDSDLGHLLSPFLAIYPARVRANLERILDYLEDDLDRWRPHVKTVKIPGIFAELVHFGLRRFKCATTREAEHLLAVLEAEQVGAADLLVAYPLVGPALERLGRLAARHPGTAVSVLCEDAAAVVDIPETLGIFIDLDTGMDRTGIPIGERAAVRALARAAGGRLRGVHAYEGQIVGGSADDRRRLAWAGYDRVIEVALDLVRQGCRIREIVTSGTPSFRHAITYPGWAACGARHRVSPGTVIYHDLRSAESLEEIALEPAALVVSRVVSHPGPDRLTCDAGSKAIAAEAGDPVALALGWPGLEAETPSEEHLPMRVASGTRPARGAALWLFPRHICPTVNLAEEAVLVDGGRVVDSVPVSARAHDLGLGDQGPTPNLCSRSRPAEG